MTVNPVLTTKKAAPSLTLQVEMGKSAPRSVNGSCVCGIIGSIVNSAGKGEGGVIDSTRVWYTQGYSEFYSIPKSYADNEFSMVAAHESGHPILASYA